MSDWVSVNKAINTCLGTIMTKQANIRTRKIFHKSCGFPETRDLDLDHLTWARPLTLLSTQVQAPRDHFTQIWQLLGANQISSWFIMERRFQYRYTLEIHDIVCSNLVVICFLFLKNTTRSGEGLASSFLFFFSLFFFSLILL